LDFSPLRLALIVCVAVAAHAIVLGSRAYLDAGSERFAPPAKDQQ
jgi:hypothetical protein